MPLRPPSPFVGRVDELAALRSLLRDARDGQARVALVSGEPGVGKSRLVTEALDGPVLRDGDAALLRLSGRCHPISGTGLPYAPVVAALRPVLGGRTPHGPSETLRTWPALRLFAPVGPGTAGTVELPAPSVLVLFESVLGLLRAMSEQAPVALVLEDLHWADPSTVDLVSFLACNLADDRVLVVATMRPEALRSPHPLRQTLAELDRLPIVGHVVVPPLSRLDIEHLVPRLTGRPTSDAELDRLLLRSGGVPFYIEELVHSAGENGADAATPASVRHSIHAELDELDDETRRLLAVAAATGREISIDLLAAATDQEVGTVEDLLPALIAQGLLIPGEQPDSLAFRHDLLREIALADLLPGQRRRLHRRIADVLAADAARAARDGIAGGDEISAELAYHLDAAGLAREALEATVRAARSARLRSALADVALHLERTLELWDEVDDAEAITGSPRPEVARELAECRWLLGDPAAAARWAAVGTRTLHTAGDADAVAAAAAQQSRYLFAAGHPDEALELLGRAGAAADTSGPAPTPGTVASTATLASILTLSGDCVRGLDVGERALTDAIRLRMSAAMIHARTTTASSRGALGQVDRSIADFDALVDDPPARDPGGASRSADEVTNATVAWLRAVNNHAFALNAHGWPRRALAVAERGLAELEDLALGDTFRATLRGQRAMALLALGETGAARSATQAIPHLPPSRYRLSAPRVGLALLTGDLETATRHLELTGTPADLLSPLPGMAIELALQQGDPRAAAHVADATVTAMGERSLAMFGATVAALGIQAHAELLQVARSTGNPDQVDCEAACLGALLEAARDFARSSHGPRGEPTPEASASLALAEASAVTALRERTSAAIVEAWRDACAVTAGTDLALPQLRARLGLARALLADGQRRDAGTELAGVRELAVTYHARPLLESVELVARRAGMRLDRASVDEAPPVWGLTRRELEVLTHLAEGSTNQEIADLLFISVKTTSVHVSNILRKLDVPNRRAAAARARDLGLVDRST